jgi:hypothetical protein
VKSIKCGSFRAMQIRPHEWEFTCEQLPGWSHTVVATESDAMQVLFGLQAEFRNSFTEEKSA